MSNDNKISGESASGAEAPISECLTSKMSHEDHWHTKRLSRDCDKHRNWLHRFVRPIFYFRLIVRSLFDPIPCKICNFTKEQEDAFRKQAMRLSPHIDPYSICLNKRDYRRYMPFLRKRFFSDRVV